MQHCSLLWTSCLRFLTKSPANTSTTLQNSVAWFVSDSWASCINSISQMDEFKKLEQSAKKWLFLAPGGGLRPSVRPTPPWLRACNLHFSFARRHYCVSGKGTTDALLEMQLQLCSEWTQESLPDFVSSVITKVVQTILWRFCGLSIVRLMTQVILQICGVVSHLLPACRHVVHAVRRVVGPWTLSVPQQRPQGRRQRRRTFSGRRLRRLRHSTQPALRRRSPAHRVRRGAYKSLSDSV